MFALAHARLRAHVCARECGGHLRGRGGGGGRGVHAVRGLLPSM